MALDFFEKKTLENAADVVLLNSQMTTANSNITGLAGVGRTTETVKGNADNIITINADLAEITNQFNPLKERIGRRVLITSWADQAANWTDYNTAPAVTFAAGYMRFTATASALNKLRYYNLFKTASKRARVRVRYTIAVAPGASSYGLVFGLIPVNTWWASAFQWQYNCCTNASYDGGRICCYKQYVTSASPKSLAIMPAAALNDIIETTCKLEHNAAHITLKNITQNALMQIVYRWDSSTQDPVNMWNFGVTNYGGTYDFTELEISDDELVRPNLLFLGDSMSSDVSGGAVQKTGFNYTNIIADRFPAYNITKWAGPGDGLMHYADSIALAEIIERHAQYVYIQVGTNDIGLGGRNFAQMETDYQTIVTALKADGTTIIHGGLLPRNNADLREFNAWIKTTYPNDLIFEAFPIFAADSVSPIQSASATYGIYASYSSDGVHPNNAAHLVWADNLSMFLIENNVLNSNLMFNNASINA